MSGKVVDSQGKPLGKIDVRFFPTENVESFRVDEFTFDYPLAISNKDGAFMLGMMGNTEGARPGKYRVTLTGFSKEENRRIPMKYQDMENSPLEVTIPNEDVSNLVLRID